MRAVDGAARFYPQDDARHVVYEGGVLHKAAAPGETAVDLRLPEFAMSAAVLGKVRQAVLDAFTNDSEAEEGRAAA